MKSPKLTADTLEEIIRRRAQGELRNRISEAFAAGRAIVDETGAAGALARESRAVLDRLESSLYDALREGTEMKAVNSFVVRAHEVFEIVDGLKRGTA